MAKTWAPLPVSSRLWALSATQTRQSSVSRSSDERGQSPLQGPDRIVVVLSPGAVTEPPLRVAVALAEHFSVPLHIARPGPDRAEQVARLPFTREFSTSVCEFRRFEPGDAREARRGQARRVEVIVTRLRSARSHVVARLEEGALPDDPAAWVLRDSAPWMPRLAHDGSYDQVIALTDGALSSIQAASLVPRRAGVALRVLALTTGASPDERQRSVLVDASLAAGARSVEMLAPAKASQHSRAADGAGSLETEIFDRCGTLNTMLVVQRSLLGDLALDAERLAAKVGLAVLSLP